MPDEFTVIKYPILLNRFRDEELARRHGEMQWVSEIRQALSDNRFRLYFQPIVPLSGTARKRHYELLLRMEGRNGEMIPPSAFLPAAERFNLIPLVDRWVIDQTLSWLEARPGHLEQLGSCGINLSGLSVGDEEFLTWLMRRLDDARVPPEKICLEITETAAIRNLSLATEFMHRLRALGCRFALDDFGTGYSSLAYLHHLPVEILKIDRSFVAGVRGGGDVEISRAILSLGNGMGMEVIAEGVETAGQLIALGELGCRYAQGDHLAPALDPDEVGLSLHRRLERTVRSAVRPSA
jgi:EAL domain-containing protein (putative c-di-GMP-specific phosphodiesterase class I)